MASNSVVPCRHITINASVMAPRNVKKIAVKKVSDVDDSMFGRNDNFRCINRVFCVFFRESAPTAAKDRTNLSSHRRSCRKPLD